jgi:hypothetical protein
MPFAAGVERRRWCCGLGPLRQRLLRLDRALSPNREFCNPSGETPSPRHSRTPSSMHRLRERRDAGFSSAAQKMVEQVVAIVRAGRQDSVEGADPASSAYRGQPASRTFRRQAAERLPETDALRRRWRPTSWGQM